MNVRSMWAVSVPFLLLLSLSACVDRTPPLPGSEELTGLEPGADFEVVMALLPSGNGGEEGNTPGYRRMRYLIEGASVEVVWIHAQGSGGRFLDPRTDLNPLIFKDRALDGWGWSHFDRRSAEWGLRIPDAPGTQGS
jgi:hypothetical protein